MSEANPELVGGTDPLPAASPAPATNVVLENATIAPAADPTATLNPPTPQPPLPGPDGFTSHGEPQPTTLPAEKTGTYVDGDGIKHPCKIVAKRKDGSVDLTIAATIGSIRIDGVQRKQEDAQVGGYLA